MRNADWETIGTEPCCKTTGRRGAWNLNKAPAADLPKSFARRANRHAILLFTSAARLNNRPSFAPLWPFFRDFGAKLPTGLAVADGRSEPDQPVIGWLLSRLLSQFR